MCLIYKMNDSRFGVAVPTLNSNCAQGDNKSGFFLAYDWLIEVNAPLFILISSVNIYSKQSLSLL